MSTEDVGNRKVLCEDIQLVQNLIERCLQLYMNQEEVVNALLVQANVQPDFTELVWQKLEEENQEFFKAYRLRLMVKDQTVNFNRLLKRQVDLMHQISAAGVASTPMSDGSHVSPLQQNTLCYAPEHNALKAENMRQPIRSRLPNTFPNGGSSLQQCMQHGIDMSSHARRIEVSPNVLLAQSSNVGLIQGMNGGMIKSETVYAGSSPYMFGNDGNVVDVRPASGDASVSSFSSVESNSQPLNETLLDADNSFGFFGLIPRSFSFPDLTVDFSNSSDILESYSGSPFRAADVNNSDPHDRGENQGDNNRLDTISDFRRLEL